MAIKTIQHNTLKWIDIVHPTSQDILHLQERYPFIHPLHLEDVSSQLERPKVDFDDQYLFIVMHFPKWDVHQALTRPSEVDFFVIRGTVITIHNDTLKPISTLYERCRKYPEERERVLGRGVNRAFYQIVDHLVDYVFPILRKIDSNMRRIEESMFEADTRTVIQDITFMRRDIISLRRIIRQQVPIIEQLERIDHPIIHEDLEEYFGDIADHLYKARDIIDENHEIIGALADTADTLASHRINEVMRILTVISVIMLPLTLISSIYGMNFTILPLSESPYGFFVICGLMLLVSIGLLWYFRSRKWL